MVGSPKAGDATSEGRNPRSSSKEIARTAIMSRVMQAGGCREKGGGVGTRCYSNGTGRADDFNRLSFQLVLGYRRLLN